MQVKFREGVSEEVRQKVHEFFQSATVTEVTWEVPVSLEPLYTYLYENKCHAAIHSYGYEILPIDVWVKEEIASFPPEHDAYYRSILRQCLIRMGFKECDIDRWMSGGKADA
jgi:hypothetical protein